jgi:glycosyltransferase involved in cell wall biosynthesis
MTKKVVFCIPTLKRPFQCMLDSLKASIQAIEADGWDHAMVSEVGCPYISAARSTMLRKALDAKADVIVFIDHDLSWENDALLKLINTEGAVVSGTYRFKKDDEEYMGVINDDVNYLPITRSDGCISGYRIPAGFLKITKEAVDRFMTEYPDLCYGPKYNLSVDLFNHGAHKGKWWGEDYSFSRNWIDKCGEIWIVPDLDLHHHTEEKVYKGNFHKFLLAQPGGSNAAN